MQTRTAIFAVLTLALLALMGTLGGALSPLAHPTTTPPAKSAGVHADLFGCSLNCFEGNLAACGSGAAVGAVGGAVLGTIGAPLIGTGAGAIAGAGIGCIAGLAGFHLGNYFDQTTAESAATAAEKQFQLDMAANFQGYNVALAGMVNLTQSQLLATENAWAAMADAVAPAELPNASFDPIWDLNQSGVAIQMDTLANDYVNLAAASVNAINGAETSGYASGGSFVSSCKYGITFIAADWGCTGAQTYYSTAGAEMDSTVYNGNGLEMRTGATAEFTCAAGGAGPFVQSSASAFNGSFFKVTLPSTAVHPYILHVSHDLMLLIGGMSAKGCTVEGNGFLGIPQSASALPYDNVTWVACGGESLTACDAANHTARGATNGFIQLPVGGCAFDFIHTTCAGVNYGAPPVNTWESNISTLLLNSATNAKAYWLFLHLLGYNSSAQVPSNCLIPQPSQILPPSYSTSVGMLTLNQTLSLYAAWLNSLAVFFNAPYNVTNFCHGHAQFKLNFDGTWSVNTIVKGFIFTTPVGGQVFATKSTWTVNNASTGPNRTMNATPVGLATDPTQIVLWPTTSLLQLPIGRVQEIPINDPLLAFVPANGTLYYLQGNGTSVTRQGYSNGTTSSSAGAAVYVSSCAVLNLTSMSWVPVVSGYCTLTYSSIQNVSFPIPSPPVPPIATGGCATGIPFYDAFVGFWAGLTGSSIFGCGLANLLAILTIIIVLVVVVYLVAAVVRRGD